MNTVEKVIHKFKDIRIGDKSKHTDGEHTHNIIRYNEKQGAYITDLGHYIDFEVFHLFKITRPEPKYKIELDEDGDLVRVGGREGGGILLRDLGQREDRYVNIRNPQAKELIIENIQVQLSALQFILDSEEKG